MRCPTSRRSAPSPPSAQLRSQLAVMTLAVVMAVAEAVVMLLLSALLVVVGAGVVGHVY